MNHSYYYYSYSSIFLDTFSRSSTYLMYYVFTLSIFFFILFGFIGVLVDDIGVDVVFVFRFKLNLFG